MDKFRFTFVVLIIVVALVIFTDKRAEFNDVDDIQKDFNTTAPLKDDEPIFSTTAILPSYVKRTFPDYELYKVINAKDSNGYAIGTNKNDIFLGTRGSDMFKGKAGDDIYVYTSNGGRDTILDSGGFDTILFSPKIDSAEIIIYKYEADDGVHTIVGVDEEGKSGLELKNKILLLHQDKKINHVEQAIFTKNSLMISLPLHEKQQ